MKMLSLFKILFLERRLPWRCKEQGGLLRYFLVNPLRRMFYFLYLPFKFNKEDDITVVIGVKNRYDYRIINAFRSIRNQDYSQRLIKIILVDYDSDKDLIPKYKKLCKKYNVEYFMVNNQPIWNRARCLNIGVKKAKTKYILISDIDIIFEKNYIKEAIKELQEDPCQVILSNCFYSKEGSINESTNIFNNYNRIKFKSKLKSCGKGIILTLTYFYYKLKGYDETYKMWGCEDDDLVKRFKFLGLRIKDISNKTSFIHQGHSKFEGVKNKNLKKQINKNREYLKKNNSIIRNKNGWG